MNLLDQCQKWCEADEHQKIIDAILAVPEDERTPEMDSELARAYNNIADENTKEYYKMALELLKPHEEYFKDEHKWNYRTAFSYYFLDREWHALHYFKRALIERPDDEDTLEFIEDCINRISFPYFETNFKERTVKAWELFCEKEKTLRELIDNNDNNSKGQELIDLCSEILNTAFRYISFELGFNGSKYELILSAEGDLVSLFPIVYFADHAPENILDKWNIIVGRRNMTGFAFQSGEDIVINDEDIKVWIEKVEKEGFGVNLKVYCEKLLPLLKEDENRVWWALTTYVDQSLGEIAHMKYIETFEVLEKEPDTNYITIDKLSDTLKDMGFNIDITAKEYLDNCYVGYSAEPKEEDGFRKDVIAGGSRLPHLINDYLDSEDSSINTLLDDGIAAGFFMFPIDTFIDDKKTYENILAFRDQFEKELLEKAGTDNVCLLGGATGREFGYVDFIAWDLKTVLDTASEIFSKGVVDIAGFSLFHSDAKPVKLYEKESLEEVVEKRKGR